MGEELDGNDGVNLLVGRNLQFVRQGQDLARYSVQPLALRRDLGVLLPFRAVSSTQFEVDLVANLKLFLAVLGVVLTLFNRCSYVYS